MIVSFHFSLSLVTNLNCASVLIEADFNDRARIKLLFIANEAKSTFRIGTDLIKVVHVGHTLHLHTRLIKWISLMDLKFQEAAPTSFRFFFVFYHQNK